MSRENVELVRGIYDALARGDDVTPFRIYAEDIVWDISNAKRVALGVRPVYRGHEGVREFWRDGRAVFGKTELEVEQLMDAGSEVVAVIREHLVGRASGAPVEGGHTAVWTLAEGKAVRMRLFDDRTQALEAAGLSE